jgi:hypothetical protein
VNSNITRSRLCDDNIHFIFDLRSNGIGKSVGKMLYVLLNITQDPVRFSIHESVDSAVADMNLHNGIREAICKSRSCTEKNGLRVEKT